MSLIIKSIGWRVIATLITAWVAWFVTGSATFAVSIGIIDTLVKLIVYYGYDLAWLKLTLKKRKPAKVVWLTGLSGAGKTTIAKALANTLEKQGRPTVILDGDYIRDIFPAGFDKASREAHIRRVAQMAAILESQNIIPIVSLISPYTAGREEARGYAKNFVEIYLSTSIDVCKERDVKGLYAKVDKGEIKNFTGIDAPYQEPDKAEIIMDTSNITVSRSVKRILKAL